VDDHRGAARAIVPCVFGNLLEWYDFAVYAFVAALIAKNFFPSTDQTTALLGSFAAFGVGFLARPLGSVIIGRIGDTRGRKAALLLTIYMMAGGTLLIAVLPTYAMAGVVAPILLVFARLLQGFSAGGEWGGAISFIVEWAPGKRRGLYGSFHAVGIVIGLLLGSGVAALLSSLVTPQNMADWGWRIPFMIGSLIGPLALYMRLAVDETPIYKKVVESQERRLPILQDVPGFKLAVKACGVSVLSNVGFYILLFYMPTWVITQLKLAPATALWANTTGLLVLAALTPVFGYISDIVGRKTVLIGACLAATVVAYPAFSHLLALSPATLIDVILVQCIFSVILAAISGALPTTLVELFSARHRTTWLSVGYGASVTLFGGFAPFVAVWLIRYFGSPIAPVYYVIAGAVLSGVVTVIVRETAFDKLK
jgi:MHS family proline/betaine transporter-like MFS transporter